MTSFKAIKSAAGILFAALLLAGCNSELSNRSPGPAYQPVSYAPDAAASDGKHIAINHHFSLQAPGEQIPAIHQKHLAECRRLGCEILNTSLDQSIRGRARARSSVRIAPQALPAFEKAISEPPAEVIVQTETAEDKSLPLLDVEKRLEAKSALRDRLTAMVRQPGQASIADLAAIERQIAEVQGDIEAATAQRDHLRTITETVRVDIDYSSISASAGGVNFSPIVDAVTGGLDTFIQSAATVIVFAIATAPWIPLAAFALWAIRRTRRRWRRT
jgi:hypothetical protein